EPAAQMTADAGRPRRALSVQVVAGAMERRYVGRTRRQQRAVLISAPRRPRAAPTRPARSIFWYLGLGERDRHILRAEPTVRIHLPPAASPLRRRFLTRGSPNSRGTGISAVKSFPTCDVGFFVERSGQKKSTCVASKVGSIIAEPIDAMGRSARHGNFVAAIYRWSAAMLQPNDLSRSLVALDQKSIPAAAVWAKMPLSGHVGQAT